MKEKVLQYLLIIQGLYYVLTAWWAYINLDSFLRFTGRITDPFKTVTNAGLFFILGLFFIISAIKNEWQKVAAMLALGSAVVVAVPEIIFFKTISKPFWLDLLAEFIFAIMFVWILFFSRSKKNDDAKVTNRYTET